MPAIPFVLFACALLASVVNAQRVIQLRSGNGAVGAPDALVRHLAGPVDAPFPAPFATADFHAARTGGGALVTNRRSTSWIPSLPADPLAKWLTTVPADRSGLYAVDFEVPEIVARATIDLVFAVDDALGANPPQTNGIYVNGIEVNGPHVWGHFTSEFSVTREVGPLIRRGTNTLFLYASDGGAVAGILFSARITLHAVPPSPATYTTFGAGCPGSAGIPGLAPAPGQLPWIGEDFTVELGSLPPSTFAVPFGLLGSSNQSWHSLPLPTGLDFLGMTTCTLWVSIDDYQALTNRGGGATWSIAIPAAASLVGGRFFQQTLVLDSGANPFGAVVTNAGEAQIGAR